MELNSYLHGHKGYKIEPYPTDKYIYETAFWLFIVF